MLKNCSHKFIVALTYIRNACLKLSYFPTKWKEAVTVPIRKPGKPASDVFSYKQISLLPTLGKILERVVLTRLKTHAEERKLNPNFQFGFRSEQSTTHQLVRVMNQIKSGFSKTQSTGMVLLDLKCAFDSVWHDAVVYKMDQYGFLLYLTKLIQSFLENRKFAVKVNNNMSEIRFLLESRKAPYSIHIQIVKICKNVETEN